MPHLTIEYSANVARHHDIAKLVDVVHQAAIDHGLAAVDALRTRAAERLQVKVADGRPEFAFIAISARIGPGRSDEEKSTFLEFVLDRAEDHIEQEAVQANMADALAIAWSIEISEIDPRFRINRNHVRRRLESEAASAAAWTPAHDPNSEEAT